MHRRIKRRIGYLKDRLEQLQMAMVVLQQQQQKQEEGRKRKVKKKLWPRSKRRRVAEDVKMEEATG